MQNARAAGAHSLDKAALVGDNLRMRELTVKKNDANQRLDRFVSKAVPLLPDQEERAAAFAQRLTERLAERKG